MWLIAALGARYTTQREARRALALVSAAYIGEFRDYDKVKDRPHV